MAMMVGRAAREAPVGTEVLGGTEATRQQAEAGAQGPQRVR